MIRANMTTYPSGRKKKYNAWTTKKRAAVKLSSYEPEKPYRRETTDYPSADSGSHNTNKVEPMKYTGTLIKGISTMHKSNAVPIIDEREAKEHAAMRR